MTQSPDHAARIAAALERIAAVMERLPPARVGAGKGGDANGAANDAPAPALRVAEVLELAKIDDVTRARARNQLQRLGLGRPKPKR